MVCKYIRAHLLSISLPLSLSLTAFHVHIYRHIENGMLYVCDELNTPAFRRDKVFGCIYLAQRLGERGVQLMGLSGTSVLLYILV